MLMFGPEEGATRSSFSSGYQKSSPSAYPASPYPRSAPHVSISHLISIPNPFRPRDIFHSILASCIKSAGLKSTSTVPELIKPVLPMLNYMP
jgi:hypothetical protein